jgi:hypothetical protein
VFALCPELAPPEIRNQRPPTLDDVLPLIIEEGCGLRPARKGGIRLETELFEAGKNTKVPVVFNYGCVLPLVLETKYSNDCSGMAAMDSSLPGARPI